MDTNEGAKDESMARNDDYLWDGSGEPDPEIQKLETVLGKFRHDGRVLVFPEIAADRRWRFFSRRGWMFPALETAVAAVAVAAVIFLSYGRKPVPLPVTAAGWDVSGLPGRPELDGMQSARRRTDSVLARFLKPTSSRGRGFGLKIPDRLRWNRAAACD